MLMIRGRGRNLRLLGVGILLTLGVLSLLLGHGSNKENSWEFIDDGVENDVFLSDIKLGVKQSKRNVTNQFGECTERRQFVYLKMIKCGSTTLANMFRMFAAKRGLSCVLPLKKKIYLGWPYQLQDTYYRPSKTGHFDLLVDHVIYNRTSISRIMPKETIYITSIREPFSQFKSMFNYYNVKNITRMKAEDPIGEFLKNIDFYERLYQAPYASKFRFCIPDHFTMSRNLMSLNLGFPSGWPKGSLDMSDNIHYIEGLLRHLDKEFHLVMLADYMPESLILLRRMMCWKLMDIIHVNQNIGKYNYRKVQDPDLIRLYKARSNVDYMLYDYFNRTLWRRIEKEGSDFYEEVSYFKAILKKVSSFCLKKHTSYRSFLSVPQSIWNENIRISKSECDFIGANETFDSLDFLKTLYDKQEPFSLPQPPIPDLKFC